VESCKILNQSKAENHHGIPPGRQIADIVHGVQMTPSVRLRKLRYSHQAEGQLPKASDGVIVVPKNCLTQ
jgi:hypothetical protein